MNKYIIITLIVLLSPLALFSADEVNVKKEGADAKKGGFFQKAGELIIGKGKNSSATIRGEIGYASGESIETVYVNYFGKYKVSELTWDISDVILVGTVFSASIFDEKIRVNIGVWKSMNDGNGQMEDLDWIDMSTPLWTHRSISDSEASATLFDMNASYELSKLKDYKAIKDASIDLVVGFRSDQWCWDGIGGTYIYSEAGFRDSTGSFDEEFGDGVTIISYEQIYNMLYFGVSANASIGKVKVKSSLAICPVVSAEDHDNHWLRSIIWDGEFNKGAAALLSAEGAYDVNDQLYLTAAISIRNIPEMIGDIRTRGTTDLRLNGGAVSHSISVLTFGLGYRM